MFRNKTIILRDNQKIRKKKCTKCHKFIPLTKEFFNRDKTANGGKNDKIFEKIKRGES